MGIKMQIRLATDDDFSKIWPFFQKIVAAGDTYAFATDISYEQAKQIWMQVPDKTYVVEEQGQVLGSYYLKTNYAGPGSHVANCGYMVSEDARGKGLATLMCEHSKQQALVLGYKAMQYNFVVSTNKGAIRLWQKLGFEIVGTVPKAYKHADLGYVDGLIMYQWLDN